MLTIQINELLQNEEYYNKVGDMLDSGESTLNLKKWMAETLTVFKQKVKLSDRNSNLTICVDTIEDEVEEEAEEDVDEETDEDVTFEELDALEAEEEALIFQKITEDMQITQRGIAKIFKTIYRDLGSMGYSGGTDGSLGVRALLFYIAQLMDLLKPGDVGVDFGSGNGETALTIACLGGFPMVLFEVTTFLLQF